MENNSVFIEKLRSSGLRPTKQRIKISEALFDRDNTFHFTINQLSKILENKFDEKISLATVYNTVNAFKKKGYVKEIPIQGNKNYYDTPIVMLSALDDMKSIIDCINLGAADYITKPIDKILLNARINNCLEKKEYRDKERNYLAAIKTFFRLPMSMEKIKLLLIIQYEYNPIFGGCASDPRSRHATVSRKGYYVVAYTTIWIRRSQPRRNCTLG